MWDFFDPVFYIFTYFLAYLSFSNLSMFHFFSFVTLPLCTLTRLSLSKAQTMKWSESQFGPLIVLMSVIDVACLLLINIWSSGSSICSGPGVFQVSLCILLWLKQILLTIISQAVAKPISSLPLSLAIYHVKSAFLQLPW